uniref:Calponin-homology (CH) domain-containing protein n=1 Tax=Mola mola TaxID=94237 RepID=A0A3Q3VME9_MOLML
MSFSTYTARRKLNRLRRSACQLFTSEAMVKAIQRLELEVEAKRLLVRKDRHLWKDIAFFSLLTIYGELISLESNNDALGLTMFILNRLLWNPDIAAEFRHAKVPHLYKDGHEEALSRFTLKKLLLLVCFLDKAKESRLIEHNPCLFCLDAEFKTSKDLLLAFSRDFLSGEGILPRHLGYLGFHVSHVQTPLDEFNFAVKSLAVDLKCGIRLVRVMELLTHDWSLSAKLRLPAISRLQKVHNVDVALQMLKSKGVDLKDEHGSNIDSRDIADGHREKTLSLLWKIIFAFHVILNEDQLTEEIGFLKRALKTKRRLASLRADQGLQLSPVETRVPYEHSSTNITLLMDWVRAVCDFYHLKVENFTVAFSDGRVLCYLIHHYHPSLLPGEAVSHSTTQTVECSLRGRLELNCSTSDSDNSFDSFPTVEFKELLENEKNNFRLVNTAVSLLGGVPAMINPADMSNTIPNEKVVMSYLSFLCARLLDLRNETRAARVIQGAWRKYRLKEDLQLYKCRATILARKTKKDYVALRNAAITIQANWRGRADRKMIEKQQHCATLIKAYYCRHKAQAEYRSKKAAALVIQRHYRAFVYGAETRRVYLHVREACVTVQAGFRGMRVRKELKKRNTAATIIQSSVRMFLCRKQYFLLQSSAIIIQSRYRAFIKAAITIQAAHRGFRVRDGLKKRHNAARAIQAQFRMHRMRMVYLATKCAAIIIQEHYRAKMFRDQQSQRYRRMKSAALVIQAVYRGHLVRRNIFLTVRDKNRFIAIKAAACVCQQRYRVLTAARKERLVYLLKRRAVICLQAAYRGCQVRKQLRIQKVIKAQRSAKRWLSHRHKAASVIQQAIRKFLLLRRQRRVQQGITRAQALWRGHCSRRLNDNLKVVKLRHRLREVSADVREEDKLCNKTSSALNYLLQYKQFSYILEALKNLETATRLSPECCERLVESGATNVIFTLIRCCNRSVPCMEVITFSIQILLNLSKYHKTTEAVYSVENSVETLLDLLQRYREKAGDKVAEKGGSIFTKACFLLALLLQDKHRAVEVMKLPKVLDRIHSIYRLTARKHKMDAERTVVKQKMNLSINGSFFVQATPLGFNTLSLVSRFVPDWVLTKDKLKDIVDPLRAIKMVANTLSIVL